MVLADPRKDSFTENWIVVPDVEVSKSAPEEAEAALGAIDAETGQDFVCRSAEGGDNWGRCADWCSKWEMGGSREFGADFFWGPNEMFKRFKLFMLSPALLLERSSGGSGSRGIFGDAFHRPISRDGMSMGEKSRPREPEIFGDKT